ncbi:MAG TPA: carboxypeptidase-like regulatory domain-containing protein [bacterium]|nr:carboxypeptidase-like regulatory domain-containing protein [bacterium]
MGRCKKSLGQPQTAERRRLRSRKIVLWMLPVFFLAVSGCFQKQERDVMGAGKPTFTLRGRVLDIDNGRPVAEAIVRIESLGLVDTVDAEGRYELTGIPVGSRILRATAVDYLYKTQEVEFTYEEYEVERNIRMLKLLQIEQSFVVELPNLSGIWWEDQALYVTSYDDRGGTIYKLDEQMNILQVSPHIGLLESDSCLVRVDTLYWKDDSAYTWIDPENPFTPDSVQIDSVYWKCAQQLYGLTRIGDSFYTSDGFGIFFPVYESRFTPIHYFRIDPVSLAVLDTLLVAGDFGAGHIHRITDLAFDGTHLWLCNPRYSTLLKILFSTFTAHSIFATPIPSPMGVMWDGRYLWVMTTTVLFQLDGDLLIRNRYGYSGYFLSQMAWAEDAVWALQPDVQRIYKLKLPFQDHL